MLSIRLSLILFLYAVIFNANGGFSGVVVIGIITIILCLLLLISGLLTYCVIWPKFSKWRKERKAKKRALTLEPSEQFEQMVLEDLSRINRTKSPPPYFPPVCRQEQKEDYQQSNSHRYPDDIYACPNASAPPYY